MTFNDFIRLELSNNDNHLTTIITKEYLEVMNNEELGLLLRSHIQKIHKHGRNKWDRLLK